ncbi:MAG: LUD domain-containing protein [Bacteroidota bacterium]|nr:LUD domain-containing protein [Bacteroidota bacterium]
MGAREDILHRIRSIVGDGPGTECARSELQEIFRGIPIRRIEEVIPTFCRHVNEAGGETSIVHSWAEAAHRVRDIHPSGPVFVAAHPEFREAGFSSLIQSASGRGEVLEVPEEGMELQVRDVFGSVFARNAAGVGRALYGFADSGAVLLVSSPFECRSLSLLVATHIAVLHESAIFPTFADAVESIEEYVRTSSPGALTLVAGPSKTADIEKVLVTGVHGPSRFAVVIFQNPPLASSTVGGGTR